MRIIQIIQVILVMATFLASSFLHADSVPEVPHFTPGHYRLKKVTSDRGDEADNFCTDGEFSISQSKDKYFIHLGPHHGFQIASTSKNFPGMNDPSEKGCLYEYINTYSPEEKTTQFKAIETLRCGKKIRHTYTKTAVINKERIVLKFHQETFKKGNKHPQYFDYTCEWIFNSFATEAAKRKEAKDAVQ